MSEIGVTRRALVTGASRGLGFEIADLLHRQGYDVTALARTGVSRGPRWHAVDVDLADLERVAEFASETAGEAPDLFVHAAGVAPRGAGTSAVRDTFAVNAQSAILFCEALAPAMKARCSGAIVLVSSLAALRSIDGFCVYGASKAALDAYARALRAHVAGEVPVLLVRPGRMATGFFAANDFDPDTVAAAEKFPDPSLAAKAIVARVGTDGEYVHGSDRWLLRAERVLPRRLAATVWAQFT